MIDEDDHPKRNTTTFAQCFKGTWWDRIVLCLLLVGITFLWLNIQQNLSQGVPTAFVYYNKTLLASYPLPMDDKVIHVPAQGQIGVSDIEISKHGVRFTSSPCPTHHCMLSGEKKQPGSVIACVPNHVMVVLRGFDKKSDEMNHFDAITE
ncbi:MAG: NusG domain II-containing protein [Ghiorsea sp.]